jgi:hypothetical protein
LGSRRELTKVDGDGPDFRVPYRYGGRAEDDQVRRDAPILLSRLALVSMVGRVDRTAQLLLLQRRVIEQLRSTAAKMDSDSMWRILQSVESESRRGVMKLCTELVVEEPSDALRNRVHRLTGLLRLRNCLAHRLGHVQMIDVVQTGSSIRETRDTDALRASWPQPRAFLDDVEILDWPHAGGRNLQVRFEETQREWKIGDQIELTPLDCQGIAMELSRFGSVLLQDFESEMGRIIS